MRNYCRDRVEILPGFGARKALSLAPAGKRVRRAHAQDRARAGSMHGALVRMRNTVEHEESNHDIDMQFNSQHFY